MTDQQLVAAAKQLRADGQAAQSEIVKRCVAVNSPAAEGYVPMTTGYTIRQLAQCLMLKRAISELKGVDYILVRSGAQASIYRRG